MRELDVEVILFIMILELKSTDQNEKYPRGNYTLLTYLHNINITGSNYTIL